MIQVGDAEAKKVIVAGFVTTELRALLSICLTHHALAHPRVQCLSTIRAEAVRWRCAMRCRRCFRRSNLEKVLEEGVELAIVPGKTMVVWSTKTLAIAVAKVLDVPMTAVGRSARSLGIVASARNRRGRLHAIRKVRLIQVQHRMVRIARSRKVSKAGGAKVCVAGIVASVLHSVGVAGMTPTRLKQGRSQAAMACWFGGPLRSVDQGVGLLTSADEKCANERQGCDDGRGPRCEPRDRQRVGLEGYRDLAEGTKRDRHSVPHRLPQDTEEMLEVKFAGWPFLRRGAPLEEADL